MGKKRESVVEEVADEAMDTTIGDSKTPTTDKEEYASLCERVNPIAQPLANRKLAKKVYKLLIEANANNAKGDHVREGLGNVHKGLRKGESGIMILAGDVWPIDVYSHLPVLCEEKKIPYIYVPSRHHLGRANGHSRACVAALVKRSDDYGDNFDSIAESVKELDLAIEG